MDALYILASIVLGTAVIMGIITISNRRFAPRFETLRTNEKVACLVQRQESSSDDLGLIVDRYYKLHVIDIQTGKQLLKLNMGKDKIRFLQLKDEFVLLQLRRTATPVFRVLNVFSNEVVREYSNQTLVELFPEFLPGVADEIDYREGNNLLKAYSKDGKEWYIDPFKHVILSHDEVKNLPETQKRPPRFSLEGDKIKYIEDYKTDHVNKDLPFIEGKLLAIDNDQRKFFIASYKTTDKTEPTFYCLSFGQQILWKTDPVKLNFKTVAKKFADFDVASIIADNVFFNFGGFIFLANHDDGTIIWQTELR